MPSKPPVTIPSRKRPAWDSSGPDDDEADSRGVSDNQKNSFADTEQAVMKPFQISIAEQAQNHLNHSRPGSASEGSKTQSRQYQNLNKSQQLGNRGPKAKSKNLNNSLNRNNINNFKTQQVQRPQWNSTLPESEQNLDFRARADFEDENYSDDCDIVAKITDVRSYKSKLQQKNLNLDSKSHSDSNETSLDPVCNGDDTKSQTQTVTYTNDDDNEIVQPEKDSKQINSVNRLKSTVTGQIKAKVDSDNSANVNDKSTVAILKSTPVKSGDMNKKTQQQSQKVSESKEIKAQTEFQTEPQHTKIEAAQSETITNQSQQKQQQQYYRQHQEKIQKMQSEIERLRIENRTLKTSQDNLFNFLVQQCSSEIQNTGDPKSIQSDSLERRLYMLKSQILALERFGIENVKNRERDQQYYEQYNCERDILYGKSNVDFSLVTKRDIWDIENQLRELILYLKEQYQFQHPGSHSFNSENNINKKFSNRNLKLLHNNNRSSQDSEEYSNFLQKLIIDLVAKADKLFYTGLHHPFPSREPPDVKSLERQIKKLVGKLNNDDDESASENNKSKTLNQKKKTQTGIDHDLLDLQCRFEDFVFESCTAPNLSVPSSLIEAWHELLTSGVEKKITQKRLNQAICDMVALAGCWKKFVMTGFQTQTVPRRS